MQYFKYKLKLNNFERSTLSEWVGTNRCLYNLALAQRQMIDYREVKARSDLPVNYNYQAAELKSLKQEFEWFKNVPGQTLQQTLMQLDGAFKRFWKGLASFPQFKKKSQDIGIKIPKGKTKKNPVGNFYFPDHPNPKKGYIKLPKVDKPFRFHKHREMEGEVKAVTIRKEGREFYISVLCDIGDKYEDHAVDASQIAAIGDRDAQIGHVAPESVNQC